MKEKIQLDDVELVSSAVGQTAAPKESKSILIWDLDYFFSDDIKKYVPNANVMKLSSYYKQLGWTVKLVEKSGDEKLPCDICYVFKEKLETPNPPINWLLTNEKKMKWCGEAVKWREDPNIFSPVVLACRPDYLIYNIKETPEQRADVIRLFDNDGNLLKCVQDYRNVYKGKRTIIADPTTMWNASTDELVMALTAIKDKKNLSFENPINMERIIGDKKVQDAFLKLRLNRRTQLTYDPISWNRYDAVMEFCDRIMKECPAFGIPTPTFIYSQNSLMHMESTKTAQDDWYKLVNAVLDTREKGIHIKIIPPKYVQDTPYFFIFSCIAAWTNSKYWRSTWLEYITQLYGRKIGWDAERYWNTPSQWHPVFRDLLRQTYKNRKLLTSQFEGKKTSINVPWELWDQVFKFNI